MGVIECFMLNVMPAARRSLRRFSVDRPDGHRLVCPNGGYHNAMGFLDVVEQPVGEPVVGTANWDRLDPRWPANCACGYVFDPIDYWQVFTERLYKVGNTAEETTIREARPGAFYWADWLGPHFDSPDHKSRGGGPHLMVIIPGRPGIGWDIDGPANNAPGWIRTGTPPHISVQGSIRSGEYHANLVNGQLVDC